MKSINALFGERVASQREHLGLNQTELGTLMKLSRNQVHLIESGQSNVNLTRAVQFAEVLKTTLPNLLFPGEGPTNLVREPDPLEALKIVERALKASMKSERDDALERVKALTDRASLEGASTKKTKGK